MIYFAIKANIRSEKRIEFLQTVRSLLDHVSENEGFLNSNLYQDVNDKNIFLLIEEWDSESSIKTYINSNHFRVLWGGMNTLGNHPPELTLNTLSQTSGTNYIKKILGTE